jgi:mRNA interferase MazF
MPTIPSGRSASGTPQLIEKHIAIFSQGDVVKVPFPYTDRSTRQSRPVLVVSTGLEDAHKLVWVVMITSAENRGWRGDVAITNPDEAGLAAPSVIRAAKIATIEATDATKLGKVLTAQLRRVIDRVGREICAVK